MGEIWGGLFVLGLIMPGLVLLATSIIVLRLGMRLKRLQPNTRSYWHYMAGHLALGIGLAIPFGPLGIVAWLVIPAYLYRKLHLCQTQGPSNRAAVGSAIKNPKGYRSWGAAVLFTITGALLPWAIGLGVKIYLDSVGRHRADADCSLRSRPCPLWLRLALRKPPTRRSDSEGRMQRRQRTRATAFLRERS